MTDKFRHFTYGHPNKYNRTIHWKTNFIARLAGGLTSEPWPIPTTTFGLKWVSLNSLNGHAVHDSYGSSKNHLYDAIAKTKFTAIAGATAKDKDEEKSSKKKV